MKRSISEIKQEVAKLTAMKLEVKQKSFFGYNHHHAIDAQIMVLSKQLDAKSIYCRYGDVDRADFAQNILDESLNAFHWMTGDDEMSPSDLWLEMTV